MGLLDFFRRKEGAAPAGDAAATAALSGPDAARALDLMREVIDPELLYERPFTDVSDQGLTIGQCDRIVFAIIDLGHFFNSG